MSRPASSSFDPDVHVPGLWRCPKCSFTLVQSNLNAADGSVTARDDPGDKCPNCNSPLWRVSWKQHATEGWQHTEEVHMELIALKADALDFVQVVQSTLLSKDAILVDFPMEKLGRLLKLLDPHGATRA